MKEKISTTQLAKFCVVMLFCNKLLALPSILFNELKYSSIFLLIIMIIIDLLILLLILNYLKNNKNINFYNYLENKLGKIIPKIIYLLFFVFFMLKIIFLLNESFAYLRTHVFDQAILPMFLIILLPIINAMAFGSTKALFRTTEFYYYFIILAIIICVLLGLFSSIDTAPLPYFLDTSAKKFIPQILNKSMWFGDYLFILFFADRVETMKKQTSKIFIYLSFGIIPLISSYVIFFNLYQGVSLNHTSLISDIIIFSSKIGNIGKLNVIPLLVIMFLIFFQLAIMLKCSCECLDKVVIPNIFNKILINTIMVVALLRFITNIGVASKIMQTYGKYISLILIFILPLIYSISLLFKRRKKNETAT